MSDEDLTDDLKCIERGADAAEAECQQLRRALHARTGEVVSAVLERDNARAQLAALREACAELRRHCLANGDYHRAPTESGAAYEDCADRIERMVGDTIDEPAPVPVPAIARGA